MTLEELKDFVVNNKRCLSAASISKSPKNKYHDVYLAVYKYTETFPIDVTFGDRVFYILNDYKTYPYIKHCKCGCGNTVINITSDYYPGHANRDESVKLKKKKSAIEKYGVENISQSKEIKEKKKQTCIEHFGSEHHMKNEEYYESFKKNMVDKIGVENPFQLQEVIEKNKNYIKDNYNEFMMARKNGFSESFFYNKMVPFVIKCGFTPLFKFEDYTGVAFNKKYLMKCNACGNEFMDDISGRVPYCKVCGCGNAENDLYKFVKNLTTEKIELNDRTAIKPRELDIYIESKKIAIEYNGLFWHSDKYRENDYHLNKTDECLRNGIRLVQIFEDEWIHKKGIVKNRLKHLLKSSKYTVGARKCVLKIISYDLKSKFLEKYHIQGNDNSSLWIGAFYKNRLVGVMTFGDMRAALGNKHEIGNYELYRFCTIGSMFSFPGLASKMLEYFKKTYNWKKIVTYSDRRWNDGKVYEKIGFTFHHFSNPNYWYFSDKFKRHHRYSFRKSVLKDKLKNFDENLTEKQNMVNNGYNRIYDCGNAVYVMENNQT